MHAKVILVLAATAVALLGTIYAGSEAMARGGGGGRGGHGGMMSGSRGSGMHGMNRHMQHSPFKGQHAHAMHDKHHDGKGNHGKPGNMQGMWRNGNQRNNNFQGQWIAGGGGGGGSVGDICLNSGVCQGVWQTAPQPDSHTSQSRSFQRSWHVGDEM